MSEELKLHLDDDTYIVKNEEMLMQALNINTEARQTIVDLIAVEIEIDEALRDLLFQDILEEMGVSKEEAITGLTERIDDNKKVLATFRKWSLSAHAWLMEGVRAQEK